MYWLCFLMHLIDLRVKKDHSKIGMIQHIWYVIFIYQCEQTMLNFAGVNNKYFYWSFQSLLVECPVGTLCWDFVPSWIFQFISFVLSLISLIKNRFVFVEIQPLCMVYNGCRKGKFSAGENVSVCIVKSI